jgi:hypothetical protein
MMHWLIPIGAIVGLITGVYTIWDRVKARRPAIWLGKPIERPNQVVIKVKNLADEDIFLIGSSVWPRVYVVSSSWEFDQMIAAEEGQDPDRLILPQQKVELPITPRAEDGTPMDAVDRNVLFLLYWRRNSSMWWARFPLWLWVRTGAVIRLGGAEVSGP